ncbi:MAG: hypothetical protein DWQ37_04170 [Planctomycetota bacterium]|nr:MAG: hypothetical protein DWQ37_04170 [Planctomycetota bacterium]
MKRKWHNTKARQRRGVILPLTALMLVFTLALIAFAIDLGCLQVAKVQLQQSADAAALAAAAELVDDEALTNSPGLADEIASARTYAVQYAAANKVFRDAPVVDANVGNNVSGEVVLGYLANPSDPAATMDFSDSEQFNSVQVTVQRTASSQNGEVALFFARALGIPTAPAEATATASILRNFAGFQTPSDNSNLGILPFALDQETWNSMMGGSGSDDWQWDAATKTLSPGQDNLREVNLYPQGTGSPGNRGTVDIGGSNNSTADIARQIVSGISPADMAALGGQLVLDDDTELNLNGDTGISAGVKDELASIIGQTRVIPLFSQVAGNGNNAQYTIVKFVGVRVLEVKLTGPMSKKRVMVQPAIVKIQGGVAGGSSQTSEFVYSPVWLVR